MRLLTSFVAILISLSLVACSDSGTTPTQDTGKLDNNVPYDGGGDTTIDLPAQDTTPSPDTTADASTSVWAKMDNPSGEQLRSVWGIDNKHIWAVGKGGAIVFYDGSTWGAQTNAEKADLHGIHGVDLGEACTSTCTTPGAACIDSKCYVIQAVGPGIGLAFDGTSWTKNPSSTSSSYGLNAVFATKAKVWTVSENGYILSRSTSSSYSYWSTTGGTTSNKNPLRGIWGVSDSDIWAVGDAGTILHYTGSSWTSTPSNTSSNLYSIWGAAADDVFTVGLDGTIVHWDGAKWTVVPMQVKTYFYAIWGTSKTNIFAAGQSLFAPDEQIVVYNGQKWSKLQPPQGTVAQGIWGTSPTNVFVVGNSGILRYTGTP